MLHFLWVKICFHTLLNLNQFKYKYDHRVLCKCFKNTQFKLCDHVIHNVELKHLSQLILLVFLVFNRFVSKEHAIIGWICLSIVFCHNQMRTPCNISFTLFVAIFSVEINIYVNSNNFEQLPILQLRCILKTNKVLICWQENFYFAKILLTHAVIWNCLQNLRFYQNENSFRCIIHQFFLQA